MILGGRLGLMCLNFHTSKMERKVLLNFLKNYFYLCVCVHTLWMYAVWQGGCPLEPEEGVRFPHAGVTGSFEQFDVGAGNRTPVL